VHESLEAAKELPGDGEAATELRKTTHKMIAAVTDDLNGLRFNRAIARIYELANALASAIQVPSKVGSLALREATETLVLLSSPMMPHLAEECWKVLGHKTAVVNTHWPKADAALVVDDEVTVAIQVNGKRRDEVRIPKGMDKAALEAKVMAMESVIRSLEGKPVKKFIVVPDRIVNIVC
jgi:leucyl-tRNA synthetase